MSVPATGGGTWRGSGGTTLAQRIVALAGPELAILSLPGPAYYFSDAAKATPCATGDPIRVAADSSGNARDLAQATLGNRPKAILASALWRMRTDGADDFIQWSGAGAQPSASNGGLTVFWSGACNNDVVTPFSRVGGIAPQWRIIRQGNLRFGVYTTGGFVAAVTAAPSLGTFAHLAGSYGGGALKVYNGATASTVVEARDFAAPVSTEPVAISSNDSGYSRLDGDMYCAAIVTRTMTAGEIAAVQALFAEVCPP